MADDPRNVAPAHSPGLPRNIVGRERILQLHLGHVPLEGDVRPALIARGTLGFSRAERASLVNEAGLFAARADKTAVGMEEL